MGRVPYGEALALQRALAERADDDYLLLLEHPHVYTLGVRADPAHVLVDPAAVGAELVRTDRGGDVTYHGPGQLVVYPIVTLATIPERDRRTSVGWRRWSSMPWGISGSTTSVGTTGTPDCGSGWGRAGPARSAPSGSGPSGGRTAAGGPPTGWP